MRHILYIILAATLLSACSMMPTNGHLDGMWQIMSVEYPSAPTVTPDRWYLCIYRNTGNLRHYGLTNIGANVAYDRDARRLTVEFPDSGSWLGYIGIRHSTPYTADFKIIRLTNKQLVMVLSDTITYHCRKF